MRIISGALGGRRILPPTKMPYTRPTTDVAKEGLFNILANNLPIPGLKTLDLFGGTGSISYELASRGATDLTIVEKDRTMVEFIRKTAESLDLQNFRVVKSEVFSFLQSCNETFDFVFAGPPYALSTINDLPKIIFSKKILNKNGWFILEHTPVNDYSDFDYFKSARNYGTTVFSIFINR
ncbi:MAG: RsmD family RNA methyltransferase [Ginsengibacter sp.]